MSNFVSAYVGRIADDEVGLWPSRFDRLSLVVELKYGVAVLNVSQVPQNGLGGHAHAVFLEPLQVADPHHHRSELMGIGVDFDSIEL